MIFVMNAVRHSVNVDDTHVIRIEENTLAQLRGTYLQRWGSVPNAVQMSQLIDDYVREEVLFREGRALRLADDDMIVRHRVVQKMQFLLSSQSDVVEPAAAEIQEFFLTNIEHYQTPAQIIIEQRFFDPAIRGTRTLRDAEDALHRLQAHRDNASSEGDPPIVAITMTPQTLESLEQAYGQRFAGTAFEMKGSEWQGPVRSSFGVHLIRIKMRIAPRQLGIEDCKDEVVTDLIAKRQADMQSKAIREIRDSYRVVVAEGSVNTSPAI